MVPVELRLSNFLSYGEEPQTLDFSQFHVACLSGKNGQGKSALLDAITWVLWGEARKSSGGHKPDEELLRIGARRMKVELVFDVEHVRYRAIREYSRSATGKTSKAVMELQVIDNESLEGRPITRASMRESQAYLNEILGLDYHTFINSAFLLQGRSDEFTKKKPNERKDILGRILNLEKYDRLAAMARDRQRKLHDQVELLKRDIERLMQALEQEPAWKSSLKDTEEALTLKKAELDEFRKEEAGLVERLGVIDIQARAAENIRVALTRLAKQQQQLAEERKALDSRISSARDLVAQEEGIEERYQTFMELVEEREVLDSGREVYRGIEKQIEQKKIGLQQYRSASEQKVRHMEIELRVSQDALKEIETKLKSKSRYEADLAEAKAAQSRVEEVRDGMAVKDRLREEIASLEKVATGKRESLMGQIHSLTERCTDAKHLAQTKSFLLDERNRFQADALRFKTVNEELEHITKKGQLIGESIKALEGETNALEQEKGRLEIQLTDLSSTTDSVCPTCGSELTPEHRAQVELRLEAQRKTIEKQIVEKGRTKDDQAKQLEELRESFRELKETATSLSETPEKIALLDEKIKTVTLQEEEQKMLAEKLETLNSSLNAKTYASDEYVQLKDLREKFNEMVLSDEALERDRFKANQVERYEEHLRGMMHAEGRKEALIAQIDAKKKQIEQARAGIDDGAEVGKLREEIAGLEKQLASIGFDPTRFEEVRRRIKALENAQIIYKDLLNAKQNLSDWEAQRERISNNLESVVREEGEQREKLTSITAVLDGKADLEQQLESVRNGRKEVEGTVQDLQIRSGEFKARLAQVKEDRATLKSSRQAVKEVRVEENLYNKLRRAFSKQGIPSLIIEQSLPEIEERANDLLSRLADGKMHVNLETLKDKKSGGTRETLEIIITDEQGVPRPYETFSGGEAFRVNFALRIALAQMLAERSGVRIRTLGIDEGFGTQDQEGIQNLIEALQVIQEDFDKIIVITHLERLKEAFPVRIEVEKDPIAGSIFTLIQN